MKLYSIGENLKKETSKSSLSCEKKQDRSLGYVHSIESMGTVDGPGIRTVVFLSGCPMQCKYCHNIDVTIAKTGTAMTPEQLLEKILKNKPYFINSGGGVTFSGGEPLFQSAFLKKCLELCSSHDIHTAIDTSLFTSLENLKKITPFTDLFLVSIKQLQDKAHKELTGVGNTLILKNLEWLSQQEKSIWVRYVLLPGITDTQTYLNKLAPLIKKIKAETIELLPYHTTGKSKWEQIGKPYAMNELRVPTNKEIETVQSFFISEGFKVLWNQ